MIDYVRAYDNRSSLHHKEARTLADELRTETILTRRGIEAGVLRWKSTGRVVQKNCAALAYNIGIGVNIDACNLARKREDIPV